MKKWQKITAISVGAVILLLVGGLLFYKFYIVPKYLEPFADKFKEYVNTEGVLDSLYSDLDDLHDQGILSDEVYDNFIKAYNEHTRDDLAYAYEILEEQEAALENEGSGTKGNSLSAKYASNKVGIEIIQTNDDVNAGKSQSSYSESRTSNRRRAEDIVEAEKIISEHEKKADATAAPVTDEKSAYQILKENMTSSEYSAFTSIMTKLDINTLKSFYNTSDKEGLKEYLKSKLSDSEYKNIVNLGYKYAYLFIEEQ